MRFMQADASPVMMAALQALADLECGYKLIKVCAEHIRSVHLNWS
jgi:hypothetical protein